MNRDISFLPPLPFRLGFGRFTLQPGSLRVRDLTILRRLGVTVVNEVYHLPAHCPHGLSVCLWGLCFIRRCTMLMTGFFRVSESKQNFHVHCINFHVLFIFKRIMFTDKISYFTVNNDLLMHYSIFLNKSVNYFWLYKIQKQQNNFVHITNFFQIFVY